MCIKERTRKESYGIQLFYKQYIVERTGIQINSVQSIQSAKISRKISSKGKSIQSANMKSQSTNIFLLLRQINQYSHFQLLKFFGVGYCGF